MNKKIYGIFLLCSFLGVMTGCGVLNVLQEKESVETTGSTESDGVSPAPESNYFADNDIKLIEEGDYAYTGAAMYNQDNQVYIVPREGSFEVTESDNGDGTKTITAGIYSKPYLFDDGIIGGIAEYSGFVDTYSGMSYVTYDYGTTEDFSFEVNGETVEITISATIVRPSTSAEYRVETYTIICPSDYDGAAFYVAGVDAELNEAGLTIYGVPTHIDDLYRGECDIIFLDASK